jgi:hypothetical protein
VAFAQTGVCISQLDPGPNWTDVASFIATAMGVVVTTAAVIVALFGPRWQRRHQTPVITVEIESEWTSFADWEFEGANQRLHEAGVFVKSQAGRDTAHDVEIFVSAVSAEPYGSPSGHHIAVERARLYFGHIEAPDSLRHLASVPAGFSRYVPLVGLGSADNLRVRIPGLDALPPPDPAAWSVLISDEMSIHSGWLDAGNDYLLELVVVGANFDAVTYRGTLRVETVTDADRVSHELSWPSPLIRASAPADDWVLEAVGA